MGQRHSAPQQVEITALVRNERLILIVSPDNTVSELIQEANKLFSQSNPDAAPLNIVKVQTPDGLVCPLNYKVRRMLLKGNTYHFWEGAVNTTPVVVKRSSVPVILPPQYSSNISIEQETPVATLYTSTGSEPPAYSTNGEVEGIPSLMVASAPLEEKFEILERKIRDTITWAPSNNQIPFVGAMTARGLVKLEPPKCQATGFDDAKEELFYDPTKGKQIPPKPRVRISVIRLSLDLESLISEYAIAYRFRLTGHHSNWCIARRFPIEAYTIGKPIYVKWLSFINGVPDIPIMAGKTVEFLALAVNKFGAVSFSDVTTFTFPSEKLILHFSESTECGSELQFDSSSTIQNVQQACISSSAQKHRNDYWNAGIHNLRMICSLVDDQPVESGNLIHALSNFQLDSVFISDPVRLVYTHTNATIPVRFEMQITGYAGWLEVSDSIPISELISEVCQKAFPCLKKVKEHVVLHYQGKALNPARKLIDYREVIQPTLFNCDLTVCLVGAPITVTFLSHEGTTSTKDLPVDLQLIHIGQNLPWKFRNDTVYAPTKPVADNQRIGEFYSAEYGLFAGTAREKIIPPPTSYPNILLMSFESDLQIFIKFPEKESILFEVNEKMTIETLKFLIWHRCGIPMFLQFLFHDNELASDSKSLKTIGLKKHYHLVLKYGTIKID